jgi:hypothetical protein
MRTIWCWGMLTSMSLTALVDCSSSLVRMLNTITPTQISMNQRFVVDAIGYVAYVTDPTARMASYTYVDTDGSYQVRSSSGTFPAPIDPAMAALLQSDPRNGALYVPLGVRSPLFNTVTQGSAPFTFEYFNVAPTTSADGRIMVSSDGYLLWRPSDACEAGQIYARYNGNSVPVGFDYSIKGGRVPIPTISPGSPSSFIIQSAVVAHEGLLMQRLPDITIGDLQLPSMSTIESSSNSSAEVQTSP